ncbi:MAG: response regulator [SAR324 cluster bacterium]|nr:response regulator [SAR324 cluster bacterium]
MVEFLDLNDQVEKSFDLLDDGIMIIDNELSVLFINKWIRDFLSPELQQNASVSAIIGSGRGKAILSRIKLVLKIAKPSVLSSAFHPCIIPIKDSKFPDQMMRQQGILTPIILQRKGKADQLCVLCQIRDVSNLAVQVNELEQAVKKRQEAEEELILSQKNAESANRAKSEFLANMSHEIRTPLNSINGFSQIILNHKNRDALPEEFKEYLNNIQTAGENLSELINNILDLSKIEAGKITVSEENLNLNQLIQGIYQINKSAAMEKQLVYNYQIESQTPIYIRSDRTKLNQILMNLIGNAIKFTPEHHKVSLYAAKEKEMLLLQVQDEGIGIPVDRQSAIFESFEQADGSTTRFFGGTGLGLAITKKMVELMGGEIAVESQKGLGSTFSVRLPVKEPDADGHDEAPQEIQNPQYSRDNLILIVEDNLMNQQMIAAMFKNLGLDVIFAGDGKTGIETVLEYSEGGRVPDLVLMDMHMPVMDGISATKALRQYPQFAGMPIVALSADAFNNQQKQAMLDGISDYLTKPIDLQKLLRLLAKYLRRNPIASCCEIRHKQTLPESIEHQIQEESRKLSEFPVYYIEEIVERVDRISAYCAGYDSKYADLLSQIKIAVYHGDDQEYHSLITKIRETAGLAIPAAHQSPQHLAGLAELLNQLENKFQQAWQEIVDIPSIGAIENFAIEIKKLGKNYQYRKLEIWGETLLSQTNTFDMKALSQSLQEFPNIFEMIQGVLAKNAGNPSALNPKKEKNYENTDNR